MSLKLDRCDVFIRGNFNPHILSPEWLANQGIWVPDSVRFGMGVLREGIQFRSPSVEWLIDTEGLVVSSLEENCGELAAKVMESLPHTPITAVGNNFNYVGKVTNWSNSPLKPLLGLDQQSFGSGLPLEESVWTGTLRYEQTQVVVTVALGANDDDSVFFNFHRPALRSMGTAIQAARQFSADQETSRVLLSKLFPEAK